MLTAYSDLEGSRTPNLLIRSQMLYPIKLRDQVLLNDGANIWQKIMPAKFFRIEFLEINGISLSLPSVL